MARAAGNRPAHASANATSIPNTKPPMSRECGDSGRRLREDLQHEPESEHDDGREPHRKEDEDDRDERENTGAREPHDVGAHDDRDRARRAQERRRGVEVAENVHCRRNDTADQIEHQEPEATELVLDVVAEDPQEQHVPEHVQDRRVEEHREQHGEPDVLVRESAFWLRDPARRYGARGRARDRPVGDENEGLAGAQLAGHARPAVVEERLGVRVVVLRVLDAEVDRDVDRDEQDRDDRRRAVGLSSRIGITPGPYRRSPTCSRARPDRFSRLGSGRRP